MSKTEPPAPFLAGLQSLRAALPIPGVRCEEVPGPSGLAPYTAAISVRTTGRDEGSPAATGVLIALYDPHQADIWGASFRVVAQCTIPIDEEMSQDPLLNEFLWVGLNEELRDGTGSCTNLVGTVTKEASESFGGLHLRSSARNAGVRCSWSTDSTDLGQHLASWCRFLMSAAGTSPEVRAALKVHNA